MSEDHIALMDGKLHVYRRPPSQRWQCSTFLGGINHRASTHEENLALAKDYALDWYAEQCVEDKRRRLAARLGVAPPPQVASADRRKRVKAEGPTFDRAADQYFVEFEAIAGGERNETYVKGHKLRYKNYLQPFFGGKQLSDITAGLVQDYRVHRNTTHVNRWTGEQERPARNTLHQEIVCLRQILKTANRQGWLASLPDISEPFRASSKVSHRAWFTPAEYKQLYTETRKRAAKKPTHRWARAALQLHDYVLLVANSGLRPDEAANLQFRDVEIVEDEATGQHILEIEVRGKRGVGYCKSMPGAVEPFRRLLDRERVRRQKPVPGKKVPPAIYTKPTREELVFDVDHSDLLNEVLDHLSLRFDRDGRRRTSYSLRHSYICFRLMEGADIYQIAKNCRTSVEMIEKHYAAHIKNRLDAAAINVRKPKKVSRKSSKRAVSEE